MFLFSFFYIWTCEVQSKFLHPHKICSLETRRRDVGLECILIIKTDYLQTMFEKIYIICTLIFSFVCVSLIHIHKSTLLRCNYSCEEYNRIIKTQRNVQKDILQLLDARLLTNINNFITSIICVVILVFCTSLRRF